MRNLRLLQRRSASSASLASPKFTEDGTKTYGGGVLCLWERCGGGSEERTLFYEGITKALRDPERLDLGAYHFSLSLQKDKAIGRGLWKFTMIPF